MASSGRGAHSSSTPKQYHCSDGLGGAAAIGAGAGGIGAGGIGAGGIGAGGIGAGGGVGGAAGVNSGGIDGSSHRATVGPAITPK